MSCLQLTLICIVLQSNIAQIFSAPISDCKSHTHTIDNKEIKVTSHVNVELPDNHDHPLDTQNPVQNHEIQFGDDSSMHIKIDISITPEMLNESAESETSSPTANLERTDTDLKQNALQKTLTEPLKELKEVREEVSGPSGIKPDQIIAEQLTSENELLHDQDNLDEKDMPEKSVIESVGEKNEKEPVGKNLNQINPLVNGKITDENLEKKLNDDLNIGSKSINDESRQAKDKVILADYSEEEEEGEVEDVEDEEEEEDGGFEELEDEDENLEDENEAPVQGVDKKDKTSDKVEDEYEEDENMQKQEQGEENENGDGDEIEEDDDVEELEEDEEEEEKWEILKS